MAETTGTQYGPPPPRPSCFAYWSNFIVGRVQSSEHDAPLLYRHQREALMKIRLFWEESRGAMDKTLPCVISLPTGTGKSVIAAVAPYILGVKNALVICPDKFTTRQLADGLSQIPELQDKILVKRKIVTFDQAAGEYVLPSVLTGCDVRQSTFRKDMGAAELIVTNAHKFSTAKKDAPTPNWQNLPADFFEMVIVDEAHHFPADFWISAMNHFNKSKVIFLTATPFRGDGRLVLTSGRPEYRMSRKDAVEAGIIREVREVVVNGTVDDEIVAWTETLTMLRDLLKFKNENMPLPNGKAHQAMACASSVAKALEIAKIAKDLNIDADCYVGDLATRKKESDFKSGRIKLLVICRKLLEGFDHPPVSVVAIMNRVSSAVKFSQFVGRAVRIEHPQDPNSNPQVADCIHHVFFQQKENFKMYNSDHLVENECERAEEDFVASINNEDQDDENEANT